MDKKSVIESENNYLTPVYQKFPVVISKGSGSLVWDIDGKEYIDCMGGYGVGLVGHSNPNVVQAITKQAEKLITCHSSFFNEARAEALESLSKISPKGLESFFFCNSGSESIEAAMKLARKNTGRSQIIAITGAYHGKTMGALSATWNPKYREPFAPLVPEVEFVQFDNVDALKEKVNEQTAGIIIEPIQGESGVHPLSNDFMLEVRNKCNETGALLILDEIQTGLGRTGRMWAHERYNISPDILCVAKGLAGGVPIGVMLAREEIATFRIGEHTTTFGGNPLACAALTATVNFILSEGLVNRSKEMGDLLKNGLEKLKSEHTLVRETRGEGLMLAIESRFDVKRILLHCIELGLLLLYSGRNTIRFLPPLVIEREHIEKTIEILSESLGEEEKRRGV